MNEGYRSHLCVAFREEVINLDGRKCTRCNRDESHEVILQVHHKFYLPRRKPWEYDYKDCETLCKGCHAQEHGKIRPSFGWTYLGEEKLEDLSGECEYCGQQIRYVFFITHEHWEPMEVGIECCDNLTGTKLASNHVESIRRYDSRARRFMDSPRWKVINNIATIKQKQLMVEILKCEAGFRIYMNNKRGKFVFPTLEKAKLLAFEAIETGKAERYLKRLSLGT